jgi:hypothetical protein
MRTSPRVTARAHVPDQAASAFTRRIHLSRRTLAVLAGALVAAAALISFLLWPAKAGAVRIQPPATRAHSYSAYTACLLTGPKGLTDPAAAPVWTALREASTTTEAQISYLTMLGADTTANAEIYINTLALRGCSAILAAGAIPADGALKAAASWPGHRIIAIEPTTSTTKPPANLTVLGQVTPAALTAQVKTLIADLADPSASRTP